MGDVEVSRRLKEARERAGFRTPTAAARRFRWDEVTYRAHENSTRGIRPDVASKYAKAFKVSAAWLLYGEGGIDDLPPVTGAQSYEPRLENGLPEISDRPGAGPGDYEQDQAVALTRNGIVVSAHPVLAEWVLPPDYLRHELDASPAMTWVMKVKGDSMGETLKPGDRILVDTNHTVPMPDGVYVIDEGHGPLVKRIQLIRKSDPPALRIISDNPHQEAYSLPMEDVRIIGRVCGRVTRM